MLRFLSGRHHLLHQLPLLTHSPPPPQFNQPIGAIPTCSPSPDSISVLNGERMDSNWSPDYCLACDKQTSAGAYCSQACRLADLETSSCASEPSSPMSIEDSSFWARSTSPSRSGFYLQPAFDFGAYKSTRSPTSSSSFRRPVVTHSTASFSTSFQTQTPPNPLPHAQRALTPSSSQSSLKSVQSSLSHTVSLSAQARTELRGYTDSFDCIRNWKRRMNSSR